MVRSVRNKVCRSQRVNYSSIVIQFPYSFDSFDFNFAESFQTTFATFGHIDIVVNNAGIMNDRFWELEVDINVVSISTVQQLL